MKNEVIDVLLNIAICDDEQSEVEKISNYITSFSMKTGVEFKLDRFTSSGELLDKYADGSPKYDILFLDVEMPDTNGIQVAEKIRSLPDRNVLIVFITSFPEYMQDSFDVQASQYLTKPLSYELFEEKLKKLIEYFNELQTNIAVVSLKDGKILLHLEDIVCIETVKSLTTKSDLLVTTVDDEIQIKGKLTDMEKILKDQYFISVHRSVLVNMKYIKRFNSNIVELSNGKTVEASRRKMAEIKNSFSKYIVMRYKK